MTTQLSDRILYRGEVFDLLSSPFSPYEHGLFPGADSSDCWRGYVAHYAIRDDRLLLTYLSLAEPEQPLMLDDQGSRVSSPAGYPPLNGVSAVRDTSFMEGSWHFHDVDLQIDFSGSLTLCRLPRHLDVPDYWEGRDNPAPDDYEHVVQLEVEQGNVVSEQELCVPQADAKTEMPPFAPVDPYTSGEWSEAPGEVDEDFFSGWEEGLAPPQEKKP